MSQLSSFGTAFVTVFGVIFVVFRSFRFGLLTIAPNVLPVLAVLGVMGYLGISMNVATVMVASVALGDRGRRHDPFHQPLPARSRRRRRSTDEAIEIATAHEGRASLTTAIINSAGYGVLLLSEYKPTAWFGGLLALTMAVGVSRRGVHPAGDDQAAAAGVWRRGAAAAAGRSRLRRGRALCLLAVRGVAPAQSRTAVSVCLADDRLRAQSARHGWSCGPAVCGGEDRAVAVAASDRVGLRRGAAVAAARQRPALVTGETRNTRSTTASFACTTPSSS